jgi:hypothetical protein
LNKGAPWCMDVASATARGRQLSAVQRAGSSLWCMLYMWRCPLWPHPVQLERSMAGLWDQTTAAYGLCAAATPVQYRQLPPRQGVSVCAKHALCKKAAPACESPRLGAFTASETIQCLNERADYMRRCTKQGCNSCCAAGAAPMQPARSHMSKGYKINPLI